MKHRAWRGIVADAGGTTFQGFRAITRGVAPASRPGRRRGRPARKKVVLRDSLRLCYKHWRPFIVSSLNMTYLQLFIVLSLPVTGICYATLGSIKLPLSQRMGLDEAKVGGLISAFGFMVGPIILL